MSMAKPEVFFSVENSLNPIGPDCGPILGDPHEEHADPGGVEVVQPRQRKWKPALPSAGDLPLNWNSSETLSFSGGCEEKVHEAQPNGTSFVVDRGRK